MSPKTETDRLKAVVRAASHAINNALCILISPEANRRERDAAVLRITAQAGGLLCMASKQSAAPRKRKSPMPEGARPA